MTAKPRDDSRTSLLGESEKPVSPILSRMAGDDGAARQRVLANIDSLGLNDNLRELEVQGYTVLPGVLSADRIERAKTAILRRVERNTGRSIDPETATAEEFNGMQYLHYLIFDDPVFPEILLEPKPLALVTYLLGESCVLSSMGCHFRGPGGMPLGVHADGISVGMTEVSLVANCNYALTSYSREGGALVLFPGSHLKKRQPTAHENWTADGETLVDIASQSLERDALDAVDWNEPPGGVTMEIEPGDAVIWHGNSWHGGCRRPSPGLRTSRKTSARPERPPWT